MTNITDLNCKKEIFPMFDFVHQEMSRAKLFQLLSETPHTAGEVIDRQNILKAFLKSAQLSASFSISNMSFNEVFSYLEEFSKRDFELFGKNYKYRLLFNRRILQRERSKLIQLVLYLDQLHQFYFSAIDIKAFPVAFQPVINDIIQFIQDIDVLKYAIYSRKYGLKISQFTELSKVITTSVKTGKLDAFWDAYFLFEAYHSIAIGIKKYDFKFPVFTKDTFSIVDFYHPLLKTPVRNSMNVRENVTLITGPNMSGKSTLLKALGLCVHLAHIGLAVPAASCELPFFDSISVAINLNDDLTNGHSHFMCEINILKMVLIEASQAKKCFAIFDELFRGTNPEDALAISAKTITGLGKIRTSYFVISTHNQQLEHLLKPANDGIDARYLECTLKNGKPVFTYKLQFGWSNLKIGQIIFEREGINQLLACLQAL